MLLFVLVCIFIQEWFFFNGGKFFWNNKFLAKYIIQNQKFMGGLRLRSSLVPPSLSCYTWAMQCLQKSIVRLTLNSVDVSSFISTISIELGPLSPPVINNWLSFNGILADQILGFTRFFIFVYHSYLRPFHRWTWHRSSSLPRIFWFYLFFAKNTWKFFIIREKYKKCKKCHP